MKMHSFFFAFCVASLFAAVTAFAQQGPEGQFWFGFTDPQGPSGQQFGPGFTGPQGPSGQQFGFGLTGPSQTVSVSQAQTFFHKSPVIVTGNVVQAIGGDLYMFRDSSGEMVLKIGAREWMFFGTTISPSDTIEISGEVCYGRWEPVHVHARFMRKL
jgi:uncharacterized protein (TIGR00156 family)